MHIIIYVYVIITYNVTLYALQGVVARGAVSFEDFSPMGTGESRLFLYFSAFAAFESDWGHHPFCQNQGALLLQRPH